MAGSFSREAQPRPLLRTTSSSNCHIRQRRVFPSLPHATSHDPSFHRDTGCPLSLLGARGNTNTSTLINVWGIHHLGQALFCVFRTQRWRSLSNILRGRDYSLLTPEESEALGASTICPASPRWPTAEPGLPRGASRPYTMLHGIIGT